MNCKITLRDAVAFIAKCLPGFSKSPAFDVLTTTASSVKALLDNRRVTSVELVQAYLEQIRKHNQDGAKLHAIISQVPHDTVLAIARKLDDERASGKCRSLLHGVPFLVKVRKSNRVPATESAHTDTKQDTMWTEASFGVASSCGTIALANSFAKANADVVQKVSHPPADPLYLDISIY